MYKTQMQNLHYPTLKTILAIEGVIKAANVPLSRNQILNKLQTKVMRSTLNIALDYLEMRGLILETRKGYIWTFNPSKKLEKAEGEGIELVAEVKDKILPVLKEHGVVKAAIFGSVARGEAKKDSDLDILVKFKKTPSLFGLGGLYADLRKIIGRRPDILTYSSINERFKSSILKEKVDIL